MAVRTMRIASASLSARPRWNPPTPRSDTCSPLLPSERLGSTVAMAGGVAARASARRGSGTEEVAAKEATWQARPERDAEIVPAMRSAFLALLFGAATACGGGSGSGTPSSQPAGGPVDGGPGDPGAGGGGTTAGAPSATFEPLDGGGDCAGLVPDRAPAAIRIRVAAPAGGACIAGTSDGTGAVAIGVRDAPGATTWHAYG